MGHEMSGAIAARGRRRRGLARRATASPCARSIPAATVPPARAGHSHICQNLKFIGIDTPGALQGLWTVPAHTLHRLPDSLTLQQGALVEPIAVACHDVRMGGRGGGRIRRRASAAVPSACWWRWWPQARGARVVMARSIRSGCNLARELGIEAVNPLEIDLVAAGQ